MRDAPAVGAVLSDPLRSGALLNVVGQNTEATAKVGDERGIVATAAAKRSTTQLQKIPPL
jgi:hypothetical protein